MGLPYNSNKVSSKYIIKEEGDVRKGFLKKYSKLKKVRRLRVFKSCFFGIQLFLSLNSVQLFQVEGYCIQAMYLRMCACVNPIRRRKMAPLSKTFELPFLRNQRIIKPHPLEISKSMSKLSY